MAKQRKANHANTPQTFNEKLHEAKVVLLEIALFLLFITDLIRFLIPVLAESLHRF